MKVATLAIIVRDDKVLLGEKTGNPEIGKGKLNGPGGKLEVGETLMECVIRETKEEMGITLVPDKTEKIAVITFLFAEVPDFEVHIYRTEVFEGEPVTTESMIPNWFAIDALPLDRMHDSDREWFAKAIRGEKFNAQVNYHERAAKFANIKFLPFTS